MRNHFEGLKNTTFLIKFNPGCFPLASSKFSSNINLIPAAVAASESFLMYEIRKVRSYNFFIALVHYQSKTQLHPQNIPDISELIS